MAVEALAIKCSVQIERNKGWRRKGQYLYLENKTFPEILSRLLLRSHCTTKPCLLQKSFWLCSLYTRGKKERKKKENLEWVLSKPPTVFAAKVSRLNFHTKVKRVGISRFIQENRNYSEYLKQREFNPGNWLHKGYKRKEVK